MEGYTSREEAEALSDDAICALSSSISETPVKMARELGLEDYSSVSA